MNKNTCLKKLSFVDTSFANLMTNRIFNVLIVSSKYDAFVLEEDGRVEEQIFNEYASLNLRYPPRFYQVYSNADVLKELESISFDLVVFMPVDKKSLNFNTAKKVKKMYPNIQIAVLTPFSTEVSKTLAKADLSAIDYVFSWLGNTDLLLAIIKLLEDKMNAFQDVEAVGVRTILIVEDSIRFYSSILPNIYKYVLEQSRNFATEALNGHQEMLRMRGRPKILLARSYEEAELLYNKYKKCLLGIISDMSFVKGGERQALAGKTFCEMVRKQDNLIPIIIDSSQEENSLIAKKLRASFINKNSKTFPQQLRKEIKENFGFGDFIILDPKNKKEILRFKDLRDFQQNISKIPFESLKYHFGNNDASRWLYSRAIFPLAKFFEEIPIDDFDNAQDAQKIFLNAIASYRKTKNSGIIAVYKKERFDEFSNFVRIGDGSLGGKGRGLAFMDALIKRNRSLENFKGTSVSIPRTLVLCTDVFDMFMEDNNLYSLALSDIDDSLILDAFVNAHLPSGFNESLKKFLEVVKGPIAIRSSSLLEDAHYQPFAGVYSTYMIPYNEDVEISLSMLKKAIKGVYASVFYRGSKSYMTATSNIIEQEKMAVILQAVVGKRYDNPIPDSNSESRFYPTFSGVGRSLNFYPVGEEKTEEGIVNVALGLGKYIVDGGVPLRFSPFHPNNLIQTSELEIALAETQTRFLCLDSSNKEFDLTTDDGSNLLRLSVQDAEVDGTLNEICSTFDYRDNVMRDGIWGEGRKLITFAHILKNETFPLANILKKVLKISQKEMGRPIEIEFAVNINDKEDSEFYLLQIRPIVDTKEALEENIEIIPKDRLFLKSHNALGQGVDEVRDVIYVKNGKFNGSNNLLIVDDVDKLNREFNKEDKNYILIGPGRWGSSDSWLGIPVRWPNIDSASLIVEAGDTNYKIDPSQGTHFFQNLTSLGVGYYSIDDTGEFCDEDFCDFALLDSMPAIHETEFIRHVRFEKSLIIKTDGMKNIGVVEIVQ